MVRMIVLPLGADWPPLTLWLWTRSKNGSEQPGLLLDGEAEVGQRLLRSPDVRADDVGHLHHDGPLGHDDLHGVAPVQRAALG